MEKLVEDGLVRSIGVSNFSSVQLADVLSYAKFPPAVNQVECHAYLPQENILKMEREKKSSGRMRHRERKQSLGSQ